MISYTLNYFTSKFGISNPKVSLPFGSLEMVASNLNVPTVYTFLINLNGHAKTQLEKTFCPLSVHATNHRLISLKTKQLMLKYADY